MMSTSSVRGPHRSVRTRLAADSRRWQTPSSWRAESSVSISTTRFRNEPWPLGPPTGSVSYTGDTATTPLSEPMASRRIARRSPRLDPRLRKARATGSAGPRDAHAGRRELLGHRRTQLAHGDGDLDDTVDGEEDLAQPFGEALEQREPLRGDDPVDRFGELAVVDRVVE